MIEKRTLFILSCALFISITIFFQYFYKKQKTQYFCYDPEYYQDKEDETLIEELKAKKSLIQTNDQDPIKVKNGQAFIINIKHHYERDIKGNYVSPEAYLKYLDKQFVKAIYKDSSYFPSVSDSDRLFLLGELTTDVDHYYFKAIKKGRTEIVFAYMESSGRYDYSGHYFNNETPIKIVTYTVEIE